MSVTIRETLEKLPIMETMKVIAGEKGLDNKISWAHISDLPDLMPLVKPGMLLLSNAFSFPKDIEDQKRLIRNLYEKQVAGLIVAVGKYITEIPDAMIAEADKLGFPVISVPWKILFVDITYAVNTRIVKDEGIQTGNELQRLIQLAVNNASLSELTEVVNQIIMNPVYILDDQLKVIAMSDPECDGISNLDEIISFLNERKLFYFPRKNFTVRVIERRNFPKLSHNVLIYPIYSQTTVFGYILFVQNRIEFTHLDYATAENLSFVAALTMSRDAAVSKARIRGKNEVFQSLISGYMYDQNDNEWLDSIKNLGLTGEFQILVIRPAVNYTVLPNYIQTYAEHIIHINEIPGIVVGYGDFTVVILTNPRNYPVQDTVDILICEAVYKNINVIIGQSKVVKSISDFKNTLDETINITQIGMCIKDDGPVSWTEEKLGYLSFLVHSNNVPGVRTSYDEIVDEIIAYDSEKHTVFLKTIECFLKNSLDMQKTAADLFVHRNTLRQRLDRIRTLWNIDLNDLFCSANFYLAIIIRKYRTMFSGNKERE